MKRFLFIFMISLVLLYSFPLFACTGFIVSNDELTLIGNNEDYINPLTKVWFIPSADGKYGCVFFGFDKEISLKLYYISINMINPKGNIP